MTPSPTHTYYWLQACGDLPLFEELQDALSSGRSLEKQLTGFHKPLKRTQRNFYKWLSLHPEAKQLISAKFTELNATMGSLVFSVNLKREKRGRRSK